MAAMDELNKKYGPAPLWVWGLVTAVVGSWYLIRRKNKSASQSAQTTQAAADQTNTNLGSASQLANLFEVAGLMPYQGGDTYVNVTENGTGGTQPPVNSGGGIQGGHPPQGGHGPVPFPVPVPAQGGSTPPKQTTGSYVVQRGDTLWDLTPKLGFGNSKNYMKLYNYDGNKSTIDSTARSHGETSNFPGHIYPGEVLHYPKK